MAQILGLNSPTALIDFSFDDQPERSRTHDRIAIARAPDTRCRFYKQDTEMLDNRRAPIGIRHMKRCPCRAFPL